MAKLIEKGTNYAYTIERIKDITFTKLRSVVIDFTRRLPADLNSELYEAIQRGVCQLQSEPELNIYIHALGLMHEAKLQHAFEHLPSEFTDHKAIEIIDYGCGQAIGTICYADFLRKNGYAQEVRKITLIEPSEIALKRAALHASCFFPNAEVVTINKGFDDLVEDDLCIDEEIPTLHIFSNVLDLADDYFNLEKFANLVKNCSQGENQYVCIEPYFGYDEIDEYPYLFFKFLNIDDEELTYCKIYPKGSFVEGHDWTCHIVLGSTYIHIGGCTTSYIKEFDEDGVREEYEAERAAEEQRFEDAYKLYEISAQKGNADAYYQLGEYNYFGKGIEKNEVEALKWYRRAAELGDKSAQFRLARFYHKGEGVPQNDNEAIKWYIKAANQGCEDSINELTKISFEINRIEDARKHLLYTPNKDREIERNKKIIEWTIKVAQHGYPMAAMLLGKFYEEISDYASAIQWYRKAAERNHSGAQYYLGHLYDLGFGVKKDMVIAVQWYRKAAEQGNSMAQRSLAYCYIRGKGVKQDYDEAIRWFVKEAKCRKEKNIGNFLLQYCGDDSIDWITKVAENGYATAQHKLGSYYESGYKIKQSYERAAYWYKKAFDNGALEALISLANIKEVVQDYEEAMSLYCEAAGLGNEDAKYKIAKLYAVGKGVEKSDTEVIRWLKQYRHTGSGFYSIGQLFYDGTETAKSYEDAIIWWKLAADENHAYAKYMLGICYENGEGIEQSYEEAAKWYKKSIDTGCIEARVSLGRLYEKGYGVEQSYEEAIKLYNAAAEYKNIKAMCCLGDCYRYGLGVKRSYNDTVKWYKMASKHYGKDAQEAKMLLAAIYEDGSWNLLNKILFQLGFLK